MDRHELDYLVSQKFELTDNFDIQLARDFAVKVVTKLHEAGYQALWAGGCVRDQLLNREPKDFDVATNARPEDIQKIFGRRKTIPIGAAFGVITVLGPDGAGQIEVATFRQDVGYSDGRRPDSVEFSNAEEDAKRRDFTINAIFFDPINKEIIDYVGGKKDIQEKLIRAVGDPHKRIEEDKLRMLRAIRISSTLGFKIESKTLQAISQHASEIGPISAERIAVELRKILRHQNRRHGIELLGKTGLLTAIFPEFEIDNSQDWETTLQLANGLENADFPIAFAGLSQFLLADKSKIEIIGRRLKLSNDERKMIRFLIGNVELIQLADTEYWPKVQRVLTRDAASELVEYVAAIDRVRNGNERSGVLFCREKLRLSIDELNPPTLLDGNTLVSAGIPTGKHFKKLLESIRDAQLLGKVDDVGKAIEWARENWNKLPD